MTDQRVSCVIPVYNGELYLGETIENALQQTHALHEIIVVDDGSTDGSASVVAKFGSQVRYLYQENSGQASARNLGARKSSGNFIVYQDADDLWAPEKTALQLACFAEDAELMLCVTHIENFASPDVPAELQTAVHGPHAKPMAGYTSSTIMVRREVFDRVGYFDPQYKHADTQHWLQRIRAAGLREKLLPDVLAMRRLHETNRSRIFGADSRAEFLQLLKSGLDARRSAAARPAQS